MERQTFGRRDRGSKPSPWFRSLGNFVLSNLPVPFRRDSRSFGPFYLVSMPGEVKTPNKEMEKTT